MIIKELSLVFRSFILSFLFIIFTSVSAFTVDLSAGAGLSLASLLEITEIDGVSGKSAVSGFGLNAFADATYVQVGAGVLIYTDTVYMNFSGFLKYPFEFADMLVFPMMGGEYRYNIDYSDANFFTLKAGVGTDMYLSDNFYLRPTLLFGYAFLSDMEDTRIEAYGNFRGASITKICMDISASIGYRF